jgi:hypothetical protein
MSRRDIPRWCLRLTSELDAADARDIALGKGLTVSQLNWTVRPDVWSVGQCLEHLCIANEVYVGPMTRALVDDNRATGSVEEINPGWFGRWFIREYIDPATQKKRYRAPKKTACDSGIRSCLWCDSPSEPDFRSSHCTITDISVRRSGSSIHRSSDQRHETLIIGFRRYVSRFRARNTPMTIQITAGQNVRPARRPGPIGLGLGSGQAPMAAAMMMNKSGPEPKSSSAKPTRTNREAQYFSICVPYEEVWMLSLGTRGASRGHVGGQTQEATRCAPTDITT